MEHEPFTPLDRMRAVELINLLDENIPVPFIAPELNCALGMDEKETRRLIFCMGMRAVVNELVEQLNEERREGPKSVEDPAEGLSNRPWQGIANILGSDGNIRPVARGGWLDVEPHDRVLASGDHGRLLPDSSSVVSLGPRDE